MSFYVADVSGYVMTGPPLVYHSLRVYCTLEECLDTAVHSVHSVLHVSLKSDKNSRYFAQRRVYINYKISPYSSSNEKCFR